jgi:hypothetical protein
MTSRAPRQRGAMIFAAIRCRFEAAP